MTESESVALPFGDSPIICALSTWTILSFKTGLQGFEPWKWRSQSPLPYHLAIAQCINRLYYSSMPLIRQPLFSNFFIFLVTVRYCTRAGIFWTENSVQYSGGSGFCRFGMRSIGKISYCLRKAWTLTTVQPCLPARKNPLPNKLTAFPCTNCFMAERSL